MSETTHDSLYLIEFTGLAGSIASATIIIDASEFDDIDDGDYHAERIKEKAEAILEATAKDWRLDLEVTRDTKLNHQLIFGDNDGDAGSRVAQIRRNYEGRDPRPHWTTDSGILEWTDLRFEGQDDDLRFENEDRGASR